MRTGRPVFHVKARWITIARADGTHFFRLDDKGKLEMQKGLIQPHHVVAWGTDAVKETPVQPEPEKVEEMTQESAFEMEVFEFRDPFDIDEFQTFDMVFDDFCAS